ncbi:MAG: thiolase C-terminal domain-containing protein [Planctomycetota bacterium]
MKPTRPVYIAGGAHTPFIGKFHPDFIWKGHPDFGKRTNPSLEDYLRLATLDALRSIDLSPELVEGGVVSNFVGELFNRQGHLGAMLAAAHPAFAYKAFHRVEGACASGALALKSAVAAICSGSDIVLAVGAEMQTAVSAKEGADYLARAAHYERQRAIDPFTFPCLFARRMKAYCEKYDLSPAAVAPIVVKAYTNAAKNPFAHMRTVGMALEQAAAASEKNPLFIENPEFHDYLKISDCSQVSDGGSCVILVSEVGLEKAGIDKRECVEIVAMGHSTGPLGEVADLTALDVTENAAERAYGSAGWDATDIDVAEVHDCFSITEALMYEALGFCEAGEGVAFGAAGETSLTGIVPVNTGGGLMAFGHPVGATGIKQAFEVFRQMHGKCGDYQLAKRPRRGLTANMGGDDRTSVVTLYQRVS